MDITDEHVDRLAAANKILAEALEANKTRAQERIVAIAAGIGDQLRETLAAIDEAASHLRFTLEQGEAKIASRAGHALRAREEACERAGAEVALAMGDNVIAAQASDAVMRAELERRLAVLANGLPPEPKLPDVKDGPRLSAPEAAEDRAAA